MSTAVSRMQEDSVIGAAMASRTMYPLSPLQEGMLFHSLYAGQSGVDIAQLICDWREEINEPAFSQAWPQVAERHPILRTSFIWEGLESPRQQSPNFPATSTSASSLKSKRKPRRKPASLFRAADTVIEIENEDERKIRPDHANIINTFTREAGAAGEALAECFLRVGQTC